MRLKYLFLLLISNHLVAQNYIYSGTVISKIDKKGVPFVNITVQNTKTGTTSDSVGRFKLYGKSPKITLKFSNVGYAKKTEKIFSASDIVIELTPQNNTLNELEVKPVENPAWAIIRKVIANKDKNNHANFDKFKADIYLKIDLAILNIKLKHPPHDSLKNKLVNRTAFVLEYVGTYYQKAKNNSEIITKSISSMPKGFPIETLMNFSRTSIYNEEIPLGLNPGSLGFSNMGAYKIYVNPINPNFAKQYGFELVDTLSTDPNIYYIKYQPLINLKINGMKGYLKIDRKSYAFTEVNYKSADSLQNLNFEIYQKYQDINNRWYPSVRNSELEITYDLSKIKKDSLLKKAHYNFKQSYLMSNVDENYDTDKIVFNGSTRTVLPSASKLARADFEPYRKIELTDNEKLLYKVVAKRDSTTKQKIVFTPLYKLLSFSMGPVLNLGSLNILLGDADINNYEKLRLGIGLQNNQLNYPKFKVYGNLAYGFGDDRFKYETSLAYNITLNQANKLLIYSKYDIQSSGTSIPIQPNFLFQQNLGASLGFGDINVQGYYKNGLAIFIRPINWTQFKFFIENETIKPLNYVVANDLTANYNYNKLGVAVRFALKEKINRTGFVENRLLANFPIVNANFEYFFNGNTSNFSKISVDIFHQIRFQRIGKTNVYLNLGKSFGKLPFPYLFNNLSSPIVFTGVNSIGFQELSSKDYRYNEYVFLSVLHDFEKHLWRVNPKSRFRPELIIGHKLAFSRLNQATFVVNHKEIKDFGNGMFEANIIIRNLIVRKLLGIGISAAYNYSKDLSENLRFSLRPFIRATFF